MKARIDFIWHDVTSYSFKSDIPDIKTYDDFIDPEKEVNNFQVVIQDIGYNQKYIDYCASKSSKKASEYVPYHVEKLREYLSDSEIRFSDEMYAAYSDYLSNQASLTFDIKPESAVSYKYIDLYRPSDWKSVLGLDIYVDNEPVKDLYMDWDRAKVVENLFSDKSAAAKLENKIKILETRISLDELISNHENSKVKLKSSSGKVYEGDYVGMRSGNKIVIKVRSGNKVKKIIIHKNSIREVYLLTEG